MSRIRRSFVLAAPLLLGAAAARGADRENAVVAEVTAAGTDECGGSLALSWSGPLTRDHLRGESFATLTVRRPVLTMTPSMCGRCSRTEYDTAGASLSAWLERFPDGETRFGLTLDGIRARRQIPEDGACRTDEDNHSVSVDTGDESPFRLTREELDAGFERRFSIQGNQFPGYRGAVQVTLRKGWLCEPLQAACGRARDWHGCVRGGLEKLLADVAVARADVEVARRTFPHQGLGALVPLLERFDAALLQLQTRIPSWTGEAGATFGATQTSCALLPGPRDEGRCAKAAGKVRDAIGKRQEQMRGEVDQIMALVEDAGRGLPDHPGVTSLRRLRATVAGLGICLAPD